jgi:hydroxyquinol 1,2-dioxygenase
MSPSALLPERQEQEAAMRNFDETTITDAVLERVRNAPDLRQRFVSEAIVRHLHDFVREVEPSQKEWAEAIAFLTRVGQKCTDTRQEFILLSDTLGVSMLVDAINHRFPGNATQTTVLGPFHVVDAPEFALGDDVSGGMAGAPLLVEGSVSSIDRQPIAGAVVEFWHADAEGFYDVQSEAGLTNLAGRGVVRTGAKGEFWFQTVIPAAYPIPDDGPVGDMLKAQGRHPYRPAHVHFMMSAPNCETLVTHLFLADSEYLDSDVVFGVKDALICELETQPAGPTARGNWISKDMAALRYDFVLADADR